MAFESFNTTPPADLVPPVADNSQAQPVAEVTTPESGTPPAETAPPPEPKPDEFIETLNKRYSTQYKTDDDIKGLFTLPSKVTEYEGKLKDHESLIKSVEQYKQELENTKTTYMSDLLAKPRLRSAYVAEQLVAKYPDRDPEVLASVAMSDIEKMSDIEAIAKERMISVKGLTFDEARLAKLADFGIDNETKPEEWDSVAKARVKIAGAEAKERIKQLLNGIELPKVVTKEEREQAQAKLFEDKKKQAEPFKEIFKKFDVYKNGDFEFAPPDDFKAALPDIFDNMFIKSGLELNQENLATAEMIKEALFVKEYLPQMLEVKAKQVMAELQDKVDKELHNDTPPNTATATDQGDRTDPNRPGVSSFFQSQGQNRATKL